MKNKHRPSINIPITHIYLSILSLSLASCVATTGNSRVSSVPLFDEVSIAANPSTSSVQRYDHCNTRVTFTGTARLMSSPEIDAIKKSSGATKFISGHIYETGTYSEGAVCGCFDLDIALENTNNADIERRFGETASNKSSKNMQLSIFKKNPNKKYVDMQHSYLTEFGEIFEKIRTVYTGKCQFMALTWARASFDDAISASRFLSSIDNLQSPSPLPSAASQPSGDAAQRLRSLKNLLDQKLIVPSEYEARRKAILDGL